MARFQRLIRFFGLGGEGWRHQANPYALCTGFAILPLMTLALWSRVWIGWWAVMPVIAFAALTKLNARLFSPAVENDGWIWAAVMGSRLWTDGDPRISPKDLHRAGLITIFQVIPTAFWLSGIILLLPAVTITGIAGMLLCKLAFLNVMVGVYRQIED